jgi:hypothetical protein
MLARISNDEEFVYTSPPTAPRAARGIAAFARCKETTALGSLNMPNLIRIATPACGKNYCFFGKFSVTCVSSKANVIDRSRKENCAVIDRTESDRRIGLIGKFKLLSKFASTHDST